MSASATPEGLEVQAHQQRERIGRKFDGDADSGDWQAVDPVLKDPDTIYTKPKTKK